MDLKPNEHKRIYFNITTMASLGLIGPAKILGPPQKKFIFLLRSPPQLFWSEIFRSPPKFATMAEWTSYMRETNQIDCFLNIKVDL